MATDSVPALMCQLGTLHLDQALRNSSVLWSHEQKQLMQKKLKSIAFETVFRYLQDYSIAQLVLFLVLALLFCYVCICCLKTLRRRPCSDFMDMLRRLINCGVIIIKTRFLLLIFRCMWHVSYCKPFVLKAKNMN